MILFIAKLINVFFNTLFQSCVMLLKQLLEQAQTVFNLHTFGLIFNLLVNEGANTSDLELGFL